MRNFALYLILALCLSACGLGESNLPKPSPLVNFSPEVSLQPFWSASVAKIFPAQNYLKLGPVLSQRLFLSDASGVVLALDTATGKVVWKTAVGVALTTEPSVDNGIVVVGGSDASLIALSDKTGAILWHIKLPDTILAPAQFSTDLIITKTLDGKICALNRQGQLIWLYDHGAPKLVLRPNSAPKIIGNQVIVGFSDGKLAAFRLDNGHIIWQQILATPQGTTTVDMMTDIVSDPVIDNATILAATYQGNLVAADFKTGRVKWQRPFSTYTDFILDQNVLYADDDQGVVWAIDALTGRVLWQQTQLKFRGLTAPIIAQGKLWVGDSYGYLHGLSKQNGRLISRVLVVKNQRILTPLAQNNTTIFVATDSGKIFAFQMGS